MAAAAAAAQQLAQMVTYSAAQQQFAQQGGAAPTEPYQMGGIPQQQHQSGVPDAIYPIHGLFSNLTLPTEEKTT
jgi:hypothetical protein